MRTQHRASIALALACTLGAGGACDRPTPPVSSSNTPVAAEPPPAAPAAPASPSAELESTDPAPPTHERSATTKLLEELAPTLDLSAAAIAALGIKRRGGELWVSDGERRANLRVRASKIVGTTRSEGAESTLTVAYEDDEACYGDDLSVTYPARSLLAKLANIEAYAVHKRKAYGPSAKGFATAARLDPTLDVAWINLACALALRGEVTQAELALAPLIDRNPLHAYHKVLTDPELKTLRDAPTLAALKAPTPGAAILGVRDRNLDGPRFMTSTHRSMLAAVRTEQSWGSCGFVSDLQFFDARTGVQVHEIPLIRWDETNPECEGNDGIKDRHLSAVRGRLVPVNRLLAELGFSGGLEVAEMTETPRGDDSLFTARFPGARLGVAVLRGQARLLRGDTVLGVATELHYLRVVRAAYDSSIPVAAVETSTDVAEGCDSGDEAVSITVIPVKP